jgi:signal transduction histidine kinase
MKMPSDNQPSTIEQLPNILIVDDTPGNLLLLSKMLTARGYRTRSAARGKLALEAARAEPPDLILLDITMPGMDGYEVCEQLKIDPALKDIPVIFISALGETMDKVKAFKAGGVDYVTKPFQCEEVYARVQTHLRLRRLEILRDDLTHMVVHDLRSPLNVIFGFLDVLERQEAPNLSASTQALAVLARQGVKDLLSMINTILDVSKLGAGEMKLQLEPCDLDVLIRTVAMASKPASSNRTVTFDGVASSLVVAADPGLIRRVLQNLLGNALRYTKTDGNVHIVATPSDHEVRIAVTDAGPGIAPEHQHRIFEKFGQVEDRTNRQGTGLGLTFCKMAVEAHGGRIGVDSEVGKGSTFWLALPRINAGGAVS